MSAANKTAAESEGPVDQQDAAASVGGSPTSQEGGAAAAMDQVAAMTMDQSAVTQPQQATVDGANAMDMPLAVDTADQTTGPEDHCRASGAPKDDAAKEVTVPSQAGAVQYK